MSKNDDTKVNIIQTTKYTLFSFGTWKLNICLFG